MGYNYYCNYSFKNIPAGIYKVLHNTFDDYCLYIDGYIDIFILNDYTHNILIDVMKKYGL